MLGTRSNSYLGSHVCRLNDNQRRPVREGCMFSLHFPHIMSSATAASSQEGQSNNENGENIRRSAPPGGAEQDRRKRSRTVARTATQQDMMKDVPVDVKLTKDEQAMVRTVIMNLVFPLHKTFSTSKDLKTKCPGAIAMCFTKMKINTTSTTHCLARRRYATTVMDALKRALSEHRLKINRSIKAQNLSKSFCERNSTARSLLTNSPI